jgi:hypothetical protein
MDRTENTASNSSSVVACVSVAVITWWLLSHCLATGMFAEPFASNSCLCYSQFWLWADMPQYVCVLFALHDGILCCINHYVKMYMCGSATATAFWEDALWKALMPIIEYWVKNKIYATLHYVIFSILLHLSFVPKYLQHFVLVCPLSKFFP